MVVCFPKPEVSGAKECDCEITQVRLHDIETRTREWREAGKALAELSAKLIADLNGGASVEPGPLKAAVVLACEGGPKAVLQLVIEAA